MRQVFKTKSFAAVLSALLISAAPAAASTLPPNPELPDRFLVPPERPERYDPVTDPRPLFKQTKIVPMVPADEGKFVLGLSIFLTGLSATLVSGRSAKRTRV